VSCTGWHIKSATLGKYLPSHCFICVDTEVGATEGKQLIFFAFSLILSILCDVIYNLFNDNTSDNRVEMFAR